MIFGLHAPYMTRGTLQKPLRNLRKWQYVAILDAMKLHEYDGIAVVSKLFATRSIGDNDRPQQLVSYACSFPPKLGPMGVASHYPLSLFRC